MQNKFNQPQSYSMKGSGISSGLSYNQRQPNSFINNTMYNQNNQDLNFEEDYYDEEVDFDTEEA